VINLAQLLVSIFVSDLLPVFVIAGVGFLLSRFGGVQVQTVSRLTFHALAPALVFNTLANSTAPRSAG
jgi:predicted permease